MPDVFLSYSSNDNFFPENWVNSFHEALEKIARVYVGRQSFKVWKDTRDLNGNDLPQTIKDELDKSKLFMTLISPSYIVDENKWCTLEREHFIYKVVGDLDKSKPRIFAVLKLYDEDDEGNGKGHGKGKGKD